MLGEEWVLRAWDWIKHLGEEELKELNRINEVVMARDPRDLARIYVEPDLQATNPADTPEDEIPKEQMFFRIPSYKWLDAFLEERKKKDGRHVAFVLSDAGMGKTSLLAMLKLTALQGQWPDKKFELFRLGSKTLEDIKAIKSPMDTVLLLDSLDEDNEAHGRIEARIEEILKATRQFRQVIVTCRTQFFPLENRFQRGGSWIKIGGFSCQTIYLSLFSDRQIELCLKRQFPRDEIKMTRARGLLFKMQSLSMRPMLLGYVEDLLERERDPSVKHQRWTLFTTYREMVQAWLDREQRKERSQVKAEDLLEACHVMAIELQKEGRREMGPEELARLLQREGAPDSIQQIEEIGGRSLLNLNSDGEYRFAHYSIQEFLVVDHMVRYPERMAGYSTKIVYSDELVRFLVDWSKQAGGWVAELKGVELEGANLRKADFRHANLGHANLKRAHFLAAKLDGANLEGADLSGAILTSAELDGTDLRDAKLVGTGLANVDLTTVRNVTQQQLDTAKGNAKTKAPTHLTRPKHWKT